MLYMYADRTAHAYNRYIRIAYTECVKNTGWRGRIQRNWNWCHEAEALEVAVRGREAHEVHEIQTDAELCIHIYKVTSSRA